MSLSVLGFIIVFVLFEFIHSYNAEIFLVKTCIFVDYIFLFTIKTNILIFCSKFS